MPSTRFSMQTPDPFQFAETAYSHGWVVLAPNAWDEGLETVERIHMLDSGRVVRLILAASAGGTSDEIDVTVDHAGPLPPPARREIRGAVTRMLRLDEDLGPFYELCRDRGGRWERVTRGLGRLLRSPTVFEDVVKTICTTNIQWGGTKRMVRELVDAYGEPLPREVAAERPGAGDRAFPTPPTIADRPAEAFADEVNLGYRAPYVHELANRVTSGELDLERLADSDLPTPRLREELLVIRGVGSYAASTLQMLLGRYDDIAVDSVFRNFVSERYFEGERPSDEEARAVYDEWGDWRYLAYWYDLWAGLDEDL